MKKGKRALFMAAMIAGCISLTAVPVMAGKKKSVTPKIDRTVTDGKIRSYLTGQMVDEEIGNKRPLAMQINNAHPAQDCNGINHAGVIYETPMEGGEVRLTMLIEDYADLERIGSMRSARTYHPLIAAEYNAIFVHYGRSKYVVKDLDNKNIDDIDGVTGRGYSAFFRSTDRKAPHNAFTNKELLDKKIEALNIDTAYSKNYGGKWLFAEDDKPQVLEKGQTANKVSLAYPANKPWFEYNEEDGLYYRFQYGEKQVDELDGKQASCTNIIVQYCDYEMQPDNDTKDVHTVGEGSGLYITGGKAVKINWSKPKKWGDTTFTDEKGQEIVLNQGQTWVEIVLPEMTGEAVLE